MHVGMCAIFQNPNQHTSDREVYQRDVALAVMAEPLGFESIWTVEHHFTDYTMCPDPAQFLTYMAGKTTKAKLGSMVIVLPWHDSMRVAEQISVLDHLSDGRMILGLGRGAGRIEFDGFRQDMGDSRARFVESAECVLQGLERGYCEYQGAFVQQPHAAIRPAPFKTFKGRTYAAAVSPESVEIMAKLGVGLLVIPQKPWDQVEKEVAAYNEVFLKLHGEKPPAPLMAGWVCCETDRDRAYEQAKRYIGGYWETVLEHYRFHENHLKGQKGYEYYGQFAEKIQKGGVDSAVEFFMNLQVWGTPEMCYNNIVKNAERIGAEGFIGVFSYAGMPGADAERSMRLFAKEVMPRLQARQINGVMDWAA
jgi:alkanesulfonate monooxygenase SsuD/methylene tetrahydromethanopterin reductase-like flavin-dependent oxidoreductase (luciferase family)